jgi:hypothetical protein
VLYRVLRTLTTGHVFGDVVRGDRFKPYVVEALLAANAICPISGPPLKHLEGWTRRAEILEPLGIRTAIEFLDADDDVIREAWGHTTTRAVKKAKSILTELLNARIVTNANSKP